MNNIKEYNIFVNESIFLKTFNEKIKRIDTDLEQVGSLYKPLSIEIVELKKITSLLQEQINTLQSKVDLKKKKAVKKIIN